MRALIPWAIRFLNTHARKLTQRFHQVENAIGSPIESATLLLCIMNMDRGDVEWDLASDEIASVASDELHDNRPNRWTGPKSSWRTLTEEERLQWQSLKQLRDQDLAVHLYDAFALKRRGRNAETAQDLLVQTVSNKEPGAGMLALEAQSGFMQFESKAALTCLIGRWPGSYMGTAQNLDCMALGRTPLAFRRSTEEDRR